MRIKKETWVIVLTNHDIQFEINSGTNVPEIMIDGEIVPVVACNYQYTTRGHTEQGTCVFTATVVVKTDSGIHHVVTRDMVTGEVGFQ